jgi:uncharacterized protein (TIGR02186 family)
VRRSLALTLALAAFAAGATADAQQPAPLVVDLSNSVVSITTGFAGAELLLFGAFDGVGEVAVVVRGPARNETVWKKVRVGGVWLNGQSTTFTSVPSFYRTAATTEIDQIAPLLVLQNLQIGVQRLTLNPAAGETRDQPPEVIAAFRAALIRNKQADGLYGATPAQVSIVGGRLFRTSIHLPANVATGEYRVDTYLFRNKRLAASRATTLTVQRAGFGDAVYRFAFDHSAQYGLVAIALALVAGWGASLLFRSS